MSGICDTFSGSITGDVLTFNPDAIPKHDTLFIQMTRGEHRIADELRKSFGGFKSVIIDVDGEQHEFRADSFIVLLEGYEGASRWHELFGTPERAARTLARMCAIGDGSCAGCPMFKANLEHCKSDYTHLKSIVEWLSGDA